MTDRSPRRRRAYGRSETPPSRYSSPDELAGNGSVDPTAGRSSPARRVPRSHSIHDDSPDELDGGYLEEHALTPDEDTPRSSRSPSCSPSPPRRRPLKLHYKQKYILRGHKKGVSQVRFSPDAKWIASASADGTIKIWNAEDGMHMRTLEGHLAGVSTIAWSPDSNTIASGSDDKAIRLWDRATGKPYPVPLIGHHNYVYSFAFSPKGNMLASGSFDEAVFLWDLRTRKQMRSLPAHSDPVGAVDFTKDGTLICSCSTDGLIRLWDTATGQCLRTLVHEDNVPVTTIRFSPNGKYILAFTLDNCIRLWDYVSGTCKKTYQGHINKKYSIGGAFGVDGEQAFLVSGSEDGGIILWDVRTKELVQRMHGHHEGCVLWVDTAPQMNGKLVSGGIDGTVRIWVDVNAEDVGVNDIDRLKLEPYLHNGYHPDEDVDMVDVKPEHTEESYAMDISTSVAGDRDQYLTSSRVLDEDG